MKNYYSILRLARDESPTGILAAYRDISRQMHPQTADEALSSGVQEIAEAT